MLRRDLGWASRRTDFVLDRFPIAGFRTLSPSERALPKISAGVDVQTITEDTCCSLYPAHAISRTNMNM